MCRFAVRLPVTEDPFCCDCAATKAAQCFPGSARVTLENGKSVEMSALNIGDKVQIGTHL